MTKPKAKIQAAPKPHVEIKDTMFTGVYWDPSAVHALQTVADAMLEQAMATRAIIEVFKAQNVTVECMLKVEQPKE